MADTQQPEQTTSRVYCEEKELLEVISLPLELPEYQRPYKWEEKNVNELFIDLNSVIEKSNQNKEYKYRLGSVILFKTNDSKYEIVDGQQRLTTLILIIGCLKKLDCEINNNQKQEKEIDLDKMTDFVKNSFNKGEISQKHLSENYKLIYKLIKSKLQNEKKYYLDNLLKVLKTNITFVRFIITGDKAIAFQLFDSQNSRGKELYPHDLLKAYHLRQIRLESYNKNYANSFVEEELDLEKFYAERWDELSSNDELSLSEFFNGYLFKLTRWLRGESANLVFKKEHIDYFKGIAPNATYRFAQREFKASPIFQIGIPCVAGSDFFDMVFYYHRELKAIITAFEKGADKNNPPIKIKEIVKKYKYYGPFSYTRNLFFATLLLYYDRFSQINDRAIETIFAWSVYPRIDKDSLHFSAIDDHARRNDSLIKLISTSVDHIKVLDNLYKYKNEISNRNYNSNKEYTVEGLKNKIIKILKGEKNGQ